MRCGHTRKTSIWPSHDLEKTIAAFFVLHGVSEPLSKVSRQKLKKFIECKQKWKVPKCEQVETADHLYNIFDDETFSRKKFGHHKL